MDLKKQSHKNFDFFYHQSTPWITTTDLRWWIKGPDAINWLIDCDRLLDFDAKKIINRLGINFKK